MRGLFAPLGLIHPYPHVLGLLLGFAGSPQRRRSDVRTGVAAAPWVGGFLQERHSCPMLFDHVSQSSPLKGLLQRARKGIADEAASCEERGRGASYRSLRMGSPAFASVRMLFCRRGIYARCYSIAEAEARP